MIVKQHIDPSRRLILAICDEELVGHVIQDKKKQLDLSADFYKGNKLQEVDTLSLISKAYMINAVGKDSVTCCIKAGACDEDSILRIKDIPFIQIVRM